MSNLQIEKWKLEQIFKKDASESSNFDQDNVNRFTYRKIDSLKVIFNLKVDKLEIVAVLEDNREQIEQYYEGEFNIEDFPTAFEFYEGTADFYNDIQQQISKKDDALELNLQSDGNALLNLTIKIKKKLLPLCFRLEVKSVPQMMLHQRNLKKLFVNNQQQQKLYQEYQIRQLQLSKQISSISEQIIILKKENVQLMHRLNLLQKDQICQQQNNNAMMSQVMSKRMEVMSLYYQLVKAAYNMSNEQRQKFEKMLNTSNHKNKKHMSDSASQYSIQENLFHTHVEKPIAGKTKMKSLEKDEKSKQVIVINSQTESVKEINMAANEGQTMRKVSQIAKIENYPKTHKKKLQIGDEQSNEQQVIIEQSEESKMASDAKPKQNEMPAVKSVRLFQENISDKFQNKVQNNSKLNKSQGVVIIQYAQDEKVQQQFEEKFGKSVKLDFSKAQNIEKYKKQVINNRVFIQRVFDDKNFYHLFHIQRITGHQNMQFTIINISKRDFTFGIMSRSALKTSWLEWAPNTSICWVGCTQTQFPNNHKNKKSLAQSDHVIVSVNIDTKRIAFYINKKCEFQTRISDHIANECYFFIETATKGNNFSFVNK